MGNDIIVKHLEEVLAGGYDACEAVYNDQRYLEVRKLPINNPPWNKTEVNILIAIPNTYNIAGLDGFYVENGLFLSGNQPHPRITGMHPIFNRQWQIVSWHYVDNKPWTASDTLLTHVLHCQQFLKQGARSN